MVEARSTRRTPTPPSSGAGRLLELDEDQCWELLAGRSVARITWTAPDGPAVVPVNYGIAGRALWIRTSAYAAIVREADQSRVAVEADHVDEAERSGWSVVVRGTAHVRFPTTPGRHRRRRTSGRAGPGRCGSSSTRVRSPAGAWSAGPPPRPDAQRLRRLA